MRLSFTAALTGACLLLLPVVQAQAAQDPAKPPEKLQEKAQEKPAQKPSSKKSKQPKKPPELTPAEKARLQTLIGCENRDHKFPPEDQIKACTVIVETKGEIPKNIVLAFFSRGNAQTRLGQDDRAIEDFTAAIRRDPKYAAAYNNRGNAYGRKGQNDRALADHHEAVRLSPKSALALKNRGSDYQNRGDFDRALKDFNLAIKLDPKFAPAFNGRCATRAIIGRELKEALADCEQALQLNPDDALRASIFDNRGFAYAKLGELYTALTDYNAALEIHPKLASALYGRGYVKLKKGDASGEADIAAAKTIRPGIADDYAKFGLK